MPVPPLASRRGVIRTDAYKAFDTNRNGSGNRAPVKWFCGILTRDTTTD